MTLSERLAAAARARGEDVPPPPPPPPVPEPEPVDTRVVIMGPSQPVVAVDPDPAVPLDQVCPGCGRTGTVAVLDLARRTCDYACEACAAMWRVAIPVEARLDPLGTDALPVVREAAGGDVVLVDD